MTVFYWPATVGLVTAAWVLGVPLGECVAPDFVQVLTADPEDHLQLRRFRILRGEVCANLLGSGWGSRFIESVTTGANQMFSITRCLVGGALALLLTACVTTNSSRLATTSENRPLLLPKDVALYRVASQVPRRYEEVALLNSTGDSGFTDESAMFESMKKEAGKVGANAVIVDALSEPSGGAKVAAAIFGVSAQRKGKALAIWIFPAGDSNPVAVTAAATAPQQSQVQAPQSVFQPSSSVRPFSYQGSSAVAAREELAKSQCLENFGRVSESGGHSVYEATCKSGKRQLIECVSGACRTLN